MSAFPPFSLFDKDRRERRGKRDEMLETRVFGFFSVFFFRYHGYGYEGSRMDDALNEACMDGRFRRREGKGRESGGSEAGEPVKKEREGRWK